MTIAHRPAAAGGPWGTARRGRTLRLWVVAVGDPSSVPGNFFDLVSTVTTRFRRVTDIGRTDDLALTERASREVGKYRLKSAVNRTCDGGHVVTVIYGSMVVSRAAGNTRSFAQVR
nr:hypothetical protein Ade03nite_19770 [Actinoplanes derwentensis]